jgi:hypothetical protein
MFNFLWRLNSVLDPTVETLQRELQALPRSVKLATYIERTINHRGEKPLD